MGLLLGLLLDVLLGLGLRLGQVEIVVEVVVLLRGLGGGSLDRSEILVVVILVVEILVAVILSVVRGLGTSGGSFPSRVPAPSSPSCSASSGPRIAAEASSSGEAAAAARLLPFAPERCASANKAVSVPERASTWWAESTVPSTSFGSSSERTRSRPSSSENSRRHAVDGCFAPSFNSASAMSSARRRGEPGANATVASSPSCRKRSRTSFSARLISAELGMDAAAGATAGDSAMEALGFEMELSRTLVRFAREKPALAPVRLTEGRWRVGDHPLRFAQDTAQPGGFEGAAGWPGSWGYLAVLSEMDEQATSHFPIPATATRAGRGA